MAEETLLTTEGQEAEGAEGAEGTGAEGQVAGQEAGKETPSEGEEAGKAAGEEGKADGKSEDGQADKDEKVGAPEKYEDFKVPEGMELDEKAIEEFTPLAKELNLSQEQAQKLVDFQAKFQEGLLEQQTEAWDTLQDHWRSQVKEDKEVGGKAFDESIAAATAALKEFGTPELQEALVTTGMGNHPEVVRVFARIGKAIGEDKIRTGNSASNAPKSAADLLYPTMNK